MKPFDKKQHFNKIYAEFKKTDEFYDSFKKQFISEMSKITSAYYPEFNRDSLFVGNIKLYADEILSSTESVIYKDKSYPEYRIKEELDVMTKVIVKEFEEIHNQDYIEKIHLKAKELIVQFYPAVIELSGNGFRLLEKYTKMYNWEFVTNFYG